MSNTFFLARDGRTASLWCERRGKNPQGQTKFWVINGAWAGVLDEATGEYFPDKDGPGNPGYKILWEGQVPPQLDYNEAFLWLNKTHGIPAQRYK